jgi:hypothetical protein
MVTEEDGPVSEVVFESESGSEDSEMVPRWIAFKKGT